MSKNTVTVGHSRDVISMQGRAPWLTNILSWLTNKSFLFCYPRTFVLNHWTLVLNPRTIANEVGAIFKKGIRVVQSVQAVQSTTHLHNPFSATANSTSNNPFSKIVQQQQQQQQNVHSSRKNYSPVIIPLIYSLELRYFVLFHIWFPSNNLIRFKFCQMSEALLNIFIFRWIHQICILQILSCSEFCFLF